MPFFFLDFAHPHPSSDGTSILLKELHIHMGRETGSVSVCWILSSALDIMYLTEFEYFHFFSLGIITLIDAYCAVAANVWKSSPWCEIWTRAWTNWNVSNMLRLLFSLLANRWLQLKTMHEERWLYEQTLQGRATSFNTCSSHM